MRLICCIYRYHYINNRVFKYFQSIYAVTRSQSLAVNLISIKWKSLSGFDFFLEVSFKKKKKTFIANQQRFNVRNSYEITRNKNSSVRQDFVGIPVTLKRLKISTKIPFFFLSYSVINRHKLFVA